MSAHTPGPWTVHQASSTRKGYDVQTADGKSLIVYNLPNGANARLIAKAPELRDLLEALVRPAPDPDPKEHVFQRTNRVRQELDELTERGRALLAEIDGGTP